MIILYAWLIIIVFMTLVWIFAEYLNNPSVVDVFWSLGLMLCGGWYLSHGPFSERIVLISCALLLWGLRLALFLWWTRIRKSEVDKRYTKLSESWKVAKSLGFFLNFQLQGQFIFIIALPFYFAASASNQVLNLSDVFIFALIIVSVGMESLADWQLHQVKQSGEKGLCDQGLWSLSRHPNYFFEWLCWLGFGLFALNHTYGFLGLISPLCLYLIMTKITGPMTEAGSLQSRGKAYENYQARTPMFFPKPVNIRWLINH